MEELLDHVEKSSHAIEEAAAVPRIFRDDGFGSKSVVYESLHVVFRSKSVVSESTRRPIRVQSFKLDVLRRALFLLRRRLFLLRDDGGVPSFTIGVQSLTIAVQIVAEMIPSCSEMTSPRRLVIASRRLVIASGDQRTSRRPLGVGRGREMSAAGGLGGLDAVCEQVDVVRRNAADVEQKNHGTEGQAHGPGGSVDVVFPLLKESRRVAQVGRARLRSEVYPNRRGRPTSSRTRWHGWELFTSRRTPTCSRASD